MIFEKKSYIVMKPMTSSNQIKKKHLNMLTAKILLRKQISYLQSDATNYNFLTTN